MEILGKGTNEINHVKLWSPQTAGYNTYILNTAFPENFCWPSLSQRLLTQKLLWPKAAQVGDTATQWTKTGVTTHCSIYMSHPLLLHVRGSEAQFPKEHLLVCLGNTLCDPIQHKYSCCYWALNSNKRRQRWWKNIIIQLLPSIKFPQTKKFNSGTPKAHRSLG